VRVRYYGFLANRHRSEKLERIRSLLGQPTSSIHQEPSTASRHESQELEPLDSNELCPLCKKGRLHVVAPLPAKRVFFHRSWSFDSS
jgi:hypothetical protein